jgi:hypothetical protein
MGKTEALRCERGAHCVSYPTLGEPSKLSRANPGPRCFACEEHRRDFQVEAFAAKAEGGGAEFAGHHHAEESRALAIRERRRASVLTCERGLHSAIDSGDVRLARTWSKALREAEARLLLAEAKLP